VQYAARLTAAEKPELTASFARQKTGSAWKEETYV
jgi:hypothetical protein